MSKMQRAITRLILAAAMSFSIHLSGDAARGQSERPYDILIVCNKAVKDNVDVTTVRDLFLRKRLSWPSGMNAVPVNAPPGSNLRVEFQKRVLSLSHSEETKYWEKNKIMNALTAPPEFEATQRAVFKLTGSVSYVFRSQFKEGVSRILLVVPEESGSTQGRVP